MGEDRTPGGGPEGADGAGAGESNGDDAGADVRKGAGESNVDAIGPDGVGSGGERSGQVRDRLLAVWRRVFALSWPVMVEQTARTLMRTTDVLVTALFSPAAVAAVGLADLYARLPLRIGLGLGGGAIALSSQDTGAGAAANRDEAVTGAVLLGVLAGLPFAAAGVLVGRDLIALLGAPPAVARQGGTYLAVVFLTAPMRHVAIVAARSLQGTGDTRTPMYVNVVANLLNAVASAGLGLGLFGLPRLSVLGVGLATAGANTLTAVTLSLAIRSDRTAAGFARPRDPTIARQLVVVAVPRVAEGLAQTAAEFPFNALLLGFGTPVNAAWQIARRLYQQVTAPLARGYNVAANVGVGQALGRGDPAAARFEGWATTALGVATVGAVGVALAVLARPAVAVFTADPATAGHAVGFTRAYGLAAAALVAFTVLSGSLQGAGDTRIPLAARLTGTFGVLLGTAYVGGVVLGYGPAAAYAAVALQYAWMTAVVAVGFRAGDWADRAADMLAARGSVDGGDPDAE